MRKPRKRAIDRANYMLGQFEYEKEKAERETGFPAEKRDGRFWVSVPIFPTNSGQWRTLSRTGTHKRRD